MPNVLQSWVAWEVLKLKKEAVDTNKGVEVQNAVADGDMERVAVDETNVKRNRKTAKSE